MRARNARTGTVVHVRDDLAVKLGPEWGPAVATSEPPRPTRADPKDAWVAYIVAATDLSEEAAKDMTKADLIGMVG